MHLQLADGFDTDILETVTICHSDFHSSSCSTILQIQVAIADRNQVQPLCKKIILTWVEGIIPFFECETVFHGVHEQCRLLYMSSAVSISRGSWPVASGRWQFYKRQEYSNRCIGAKELPSSMMIWKETTTWAIVAAPTWIFTMGLQSCLFLTWATPTYISGAQLVWKTYHVGCRRNQLEEIVCNHW